VPHIIIEYADQLADDAEVVAILQAVHHATADSGLFKANQIIKLVPNHSGSLPMQVEAILISISRQELNLDGMLIIKNILVKLF